MRIKQFRELRLCRTARARSQMPHFVYFAIAPGVHSTAPRMHATRPTPHTCLLHVEGLAIGMLAVSGYVTQTAVASEIGRCRIRHGYGVKVVCGGST